MLFNQGTAVYSNYLMVWKGLLQYFSCFFVIHRLIVCRVENNVVHNQEIGVSCRQAFAVFFYLCLLYTSQAGNDHPENIVVEIDMERSENVRRWWPFLRDRRIDEYDGLTKRFLD